MVSQGRGREDHQRAWQALGLAYPAWNDFTNPSRFVGWPEARYAGPRPADVLVLISTTPCTTLTGIANAGMS
jgi:hypothetical protein